MSSDEDACSAAAGQESFGEWMSVNGAHHRVDGIAFWLSDDWPVAVFFLPCDAVLGGEAHFFGFDVEAVFVGVWLEHGAVDDRAEAHGGSFFFGEAVEVGCQMRGGLVGQEVEHGFGATVGGVIAFGGD